MKFSIPSKFNDPNYCDIANKVKAFSQQDVDNIFSEAKFSNDYINGQLADFIYEYLHVIPRWLAERKPAAV